MEAGIGSSAPEERWGWNSDLPTFYGVSPRVVRLSLESFLRDAGPPQRRAWTDSIPWLQEECRDLVRCEEGARRYTAILEYTLPRESRRPDVILLEGGTVVVLELKGATEPSQAALDQIGAYARDLRCYHAACAERPVVPILVPMRADALQREVDGVLVAGPHGIHEVLLDLARRFHAPPLAPEEFLRSDAYAPLPSLVQAARDLFAHEPLPTLRRAKAATDPAVETITRIAHDAARTGTRRLVLLTGIPGSGKTLVGLRLVHAGFLDDLAIDRGGGKPAAPAVFLSGNDPLVLVLQDALKDAGGGGKVFVRPVREYVKEYSRAASAVPPEHLLVFDEAQRAWDKDHVARKSKIPASQARSEPEHFISFAERIPGWCVVVGLVGTGQEIHAGEQSGVAQWGSAIAKSPESGTWTVHAASDLDAALGKTGVATTWEPSLTLDTELRFHDARNLHDFVESLLSEATSTATRELGDRLWREGYRLFVTRDLEAAKRYARQRFVDDDKARYGLLASSKAKDLPRFGVDNTYRRGSWWVGPWYNAPPEEQTSCCRLEMVATEFQAQGLELDLVLLGWGSDLLVEDGRWHSERSGKTRYVEDILTLRKNVYRVLLTRGRRGTVIFVPPDALYDETHARLVAAGARTRLA